MINTHERQIICCNTKEIFNSISDASNKYDVLASSILLCCQRKYKYAGKDPVTNKKLIWQQIICVLYNIINLSYVL